MSYNPTPNRPTPSEDEAFNKLSALCARAEHSSGEMVDKMRRWGIDDETQARIMARLVSGKYIDDERYARLFVEDKIRFDHWGRTKIALTLRRKGIDSTTAASVLDDIDDDRYLEVLRPLIQAKRRTVKARNDYERTGKLMRFALSRGFTMDQIRRCLDGADEYEYDMTDDDE